MMYTSDPRDDTDHLAPPQHLREASYKLTGETYDLRNEGLKEMLLQIQDRQLDDCIKPEFLLSFLRSQKFRVDRAMRIYERYVHTREKHPSLRIVNHSLVQRLFSSGAFSILPTTDNRGRRILSMNMKELSPLVDSLNVNDSDVLLAALFGMLETVMLTIEAQIFGVVIIADLTRCRLKTFRYLTTSQYLLSLDLCQHCLPLRARGMFLIHEPFYVTAMFNLMRTFMKPMVKENLRCFGSNVTKVHEYIAMDSLPANFNGSLKYNREAHAKKWAAIVQQNAT